MPATAVSVPAEPVVKVEYTTAPAVSSGGLSYKQALQSAAISESAVVATAANSSNPNSAVVHSGATHEEIMYAQRPGDGGLVKG